MTTSDWDVLREAATTLIDQVKQRLEGYRTELTNPLEFINSKGGLEDTDGSRANSFAAFVVSLQTLYRRSLTLPKRHNEVIDLLKGVEHDLRDLAAAQE